MSIAIIIFSLYCLSCICSFLFSTFHIFDPLSLFFTFVLYCSLFCWCLSFVSHYFISFIYFTLVLLFVVHRSSFFPCYFSLQMFSILAKQALLRSRDSAKYVAPSSALATRPTPSWASFRWRCRWWCWPGCALVFLFLQLPHKASLHFVFCGFAGGPQGPLTPYVVRLLLLLHCYCYCFQASRSFGARSSTAPGPALLRSRPAQNPRSPLRNPNPQSRNPYSGNIDPSQLPLASLNFEWETAKTKVL